VLEGEGEKWREGKREREIGIERQREGGEYMCENIPSVIIN